MLISLWAENFEIYKPIYADFISTAYHSRSQKCTTFVCPSFVNLSKEHELLKVLAENESSIITATVINKASSGCMLLEMITKCFLNEIIFQLFLRQNHDSLNLLVRPYIVD